MVELEYKQYASKLEEYFLVNVLHEEVKVMKTGWKLLFPITGWGATNFNYGKPKQYQDWLFNQGYILIKKNKKQYLRFFDEATATMFVLKWS